MEKNDLVRRTARFLSHVIVDFLFVAALVWGMHFILSWPWILIGIVTLFMVAIRVEEWHDPLK